MGMKKSLEWLYQYQRLGTKLGLERINALVNRLGNPQLTYKTVHVGGTNGKGSVCQILGSILTAGGYKVGVYTSPHLTDIKERISINGAHISEQELNETIERIQPIVKDVENKGDTPSFFEVFTALAFEYFKNEKVDIVIVEVGLGGRYDATNVIKPELTILTDISLDHIEELGSDIHKVSSEKAGIIKTGVPVITAAKKNALSVIRETTKKSNVDLTVVNKKIWRRIDFSIDQQKFLIQGKETNYSVTTSLLGEYQGENIALAVYAAEALNNVGFSLDPDVIEQGIIAAKNPGRMEVVKKKPLVILDGAHNPRGIQVLIETLNHDFSYNRLIGIIGILKDKDVDAMVKTFSTRATHVIVTKPNSDRACDTDFLSSLLKKHNPNLIVESVDRVVESVSRALEIADADDIICVTGSLYTVGEARRFFSK